MNEKYYNALTLPLAAHNFSESFITACTEHGYFTLLDLFSASIEELKATEWFLPSFQEELTNLVNVLRKEE